MQEESLQTSSLSEKQIEAAINSSRSNRYTYSILAIILLFLGNIGGYLALTSIPILMYEPKYLCYSKVTKEFTLECGVEKVCLKINQLGTDYIIDPETVNVRSLITAFDLYCSKGKKIVLGTSYFIGGMIGIILIPFFISWMGCLNTIVLGYLLFFLSGGLLSFINNIIIVMILYIIFHISLNLIMTCVPQYLIEMTEPKHRSFFIGIQFLSVGFSGYLSVLISYYTLDYRYVLVAGSAVCLIFGILTKIFLVDSIRTSFIRGKQYDILKDLEYIAKVNQSQIEYRVWRDQNINRGAILHKPTNDDKKYNYPSFMSIWKYKSQIKLIVLFSFVSFLANYGLLLIQFEIKKQDDFFSSLAIAFSSDIVGVVIGCGSTEIPALKRKISFMMIIFSLIVSYFCNAIAYSQHYTGMFILMRIFAYAIFSNYTIYNFEIYPTMIRPTGVAINRIFARVFNLWTPYLMISFPRTGYILGVFFCAAILGMTCIFPVEETKGEVIREFPKEVIEEREKHDKGDEDSLLIKDENHENFKEK